MVLRNKIAIVILILSYSVQQIAYAQDIMIYDSEILKSIGEMVDSNSSNLPDLPIVRLCDDKRVTHIGIDIFGDKIKECNNVILLNFVERYLLEMLSEKSSNIATERMEFDDVTIGGDLSKIPLLSSIQGDITLDIINDSNLYTIKWGDADNFISISFPINYSFILGKNKIELEDALYGDLMKYAEREIDEKFDRKYNSLSKIADNIYEDSKGYYGIKSIHNTSYYECVDNEYSCIFDLERSLESLYNVICNNNSVECPITLYITQNKYGFRHEEYCYPLNKLITFCLDQGCTPYIGIEENSKDTIIASIYMVNYEYGYNHILKLKVDKEQLFADDGTASMEINCYIPTNNISILFDDKQQKRSKHKIKL